MSEQSIRPGDHVRLISKPDGYFGRHYPLTVGASYRVIYLDGSNVATTCDEPGRTVSYWRGRVERVRPHADRHGRFR